jgi:hypothetical protein
MKNKFFLMVAGMASLAASQAGAGVALQQCSAQAFCPQTGRFVSCTVYSDPVYGQSCTYETRLGYGVRCTGWDLAGRWVVYQDYCIY